MPLASPCIGPPSGFGSAVGSEPTEEFGTAGGKKGRTVTLRPVVDALTARQAAVAGRWDCRYPRRRKRIGVEMRLQEAGEGDHGVEAADIGRLDRTRDAEAPADRVAHNGIDCLSRGYARYPERPGLTKCCELNAVADEAGNFLVDHNWLLAGAPDQLDGPGKDGRARLRPGADLDQWDEL